MCLIASKLVGTAVSSLAMLPRDFARNSMLTQFAALHFKLALDRGEGSDNYEDVQFTYKPQLNPDRDGDLMEVLPDYLVEEITFPRPHASKFYSRVIKSLTERTE